MGDVYIEPPKPNAVGAKVAELIADGHEFYATVVAGQPAGRVRRPTLFVIAALGTILATQHIAGAIVGLIAIVLLAVTDNVVEL